MSPQLFPDFDKSISDSHVLTIGNFDGVHRGHQRLLGEVVATARTRGVRSAALTFDPLPLEVLRPEVSPPRLTTTSDRLKLIAALGIDSVVVDYRGGGAGFVDAGNPIRPVPLGRTPSKAGASA